MNIAKTKGGVWCYLCAVSGTFGRYCSRPKFNGLRTNSSTLEEVLISQRTFVEIPVYIGKWIDSGRKGERKSPSDSLFRHRRILFGNDSEEERDHDDLTVRQKTPCITAWKTTQNAVYWLRLLKAQDLGLEFWQTVICNHDLRKDSWRLH